MLIFFQVEDKRGTNWIEIRQKSKDKYKFWAAFYLPLLKVGFYETVTLLETIG